MKRAMLKRGVEGVCDVERVWRCYGGDALSTSYMGEECDE